MARVLILANSDLGLYKFRKELLQELIKRGNEIIISLPQGEFIPDLIYMGCQYIESFIDRRGINPFTDSKVLFNYLKIVTKVKPDLIISYTIKPNIYGGLVSRVQKIPYIINITGLGTSLQKNSILKCFIIMLYKLICKNAKLVFFENVENKQKLLYYNIVRENQTFLLNGAGVNLDEYCTSEYPDCETIHFLFIGRIMKEKGIDELFDVAKKIKSEFDNVIFDIVGSYEDNYKNKIEILQKQNVVLYHGYQPDIKPFIQKSHCFVLPSYHEGMANTLLECGAMGRPLIASNIHGCKEAIIDGENGFLVNVKDVEDLYKKIKKFIKLSYETKKEMGKASRIHIEKVFDKNNIVEMTIQKIESVLRTGC